MKLYLLDCENYFDTIFGNENFSDNISDSQKKHSQLCIDSHTNILLHINVVEIFDRKSAYK